MTKFLDRLITFFFYLLFFLTPIILWPYTSELFEFNKMVFVYAMTILIVAAWLSKCLTAKKFLFRRTILDIPLLIFLGSQILSTIFSIDPRTSLLGYYSRFNGGLLSILCYSLLYWAFISNLNKKQVLYTLYSILFSAALVAVYGILEHFGIDKNLWVQDVQNRVFSTLGQPNWLAAYITTLLPIAMSGAISNFKFLISKQTQNHKFQILNTIPYFLSVLLFTTLLFTKSRSGLLGFAIAFGIFWAGAFWIYRRAALKSFLVLGSSFLVISLLVGFPALPSEARRAELGPALETGGTESGQIRKIVWQGAIDIWKHYPLFGSGVETFAYSYYQFRPRAHNLVSEWDFLYNKAHNEYLNYLATTGTIGTFSYLMVIFFSLLQISKFPALLAGYVSILVTNFFGFSVVPVNLFFFLFPAMAMTIANSKPEILNSKNEKLNPIQKTVLLILFLVISYSLLVICRYWYADILFAKGRQLNQQNNYPAAFRSLQKAIVLSPNEALYHNEIAQTAAELAAADNQFTDLAISESDKAIALSPANVNLLRNRATMFLKLAQINPGYLTDAKETLESATKKAPTDAKIFYNLALTNLRLGKTNEVLSVLEKTIELKPNYKEARFAYALVLIDQGEKQKAKEELTYILAKIDPNDRLTKEELKKL